MQLSSSQSATVVEISLEPGDELVESLQRALRDSNVRSAFLVGSGELEDAEVMTLASSGASRSPHKLKGACDLLSLSGSYEGGALELRGTLARETEVGPQLLGGSITRATVVSAQARAIVRSSDGPRPVVPAPPSSPHTEPVTALPLPPPRDSSPVITPAPTERATPARDERPSAPTAAPLAGPPLPPRPRRNDSPDVYPEENDVVTHFAFGRCIVLFSDGERIRFQQERDGRVREVALSMLRIGEPTIDAEGRRNWELARKN